MIYFFETFFVLLYTSYNFSLLAFLLVFFIFHLKKYKKVMASGKGRSIYVIRLILDYFLPIIMAAFLWSAFLPNALSSASGGGLGDVLIVPFCWASAIVLLILSPFTLDRFLRKSKTLGQLVQRSLIILSILVVVGGLLNIWSNKIQRDSAAGLQRWNQERASDEQL